MHVPDPLLINLLTSHKEVRFENSLQSNIGQSAKKVDCKTALKWLFAETAQRLRIDKNAQELVVTFGYKHRGSKSEKYIAGFYLF